MSNRDYFVGCHQHGRFDYFCQPCLVMTVTKLVDAVDGAKTAIDNLKTAFESNMEEIDRNARAYGWEIGHGHPLAVRIDETSPDNPFTNVSWRDNVDRTEGWEFGPQIIAGWLDEIPDVDGTDAAPEGAGGVE